ncbi:MAG TPA: SDR family oxidoreductase [Anaerolineae bacterium]|jgi:NAD(P)-dependent dehydrogenase (short-subunit alcohol dehydrogenase family)|nr:SDR family oxidoreductase [Anaerolineae bacterium]
MGKLEGKKAIITGGDSGIGRAVAVAFAREGADVAINYITGDEQDAQETKRMVEEKGRRAILIQADIGYEEQVKEILNIVMDEFGRIDILVNNAGVEHIAPIEEVDYALWQRIMKTNIDGMFLMTKYALPHMPDGGRIINTGSIEGLEGNPTSIPYSASKGAVHTFTKSIARYLVDRRILVNAVAPGPVETPLAKREHPELIKAGGGEKYPLGVAKPEQIAETYVFLASDDASYYSGEVLAPTGGHVTAA